MGVGTPVIRIWIIPCWFECRRVRWVCLGWHRRPFQGQEWSKRSSCTSMKPQPVCRRSPIERWLTGNFVRRAGHTLPLPLLRSEKDGSWPRGVWDPQPLHYNRCGADAAYGHRDFLQRFVMIHPWFLEFARCPLSQSPLLPADAQLLQRVNHAIADGRLTNHAQQPVEQAVSAAVVNHDRSFLYPVRNQIPALTEGQAIALDQLDSPG